MQSKSTDAYVTDGGTPNAIKGNVDSNDASKFGGSGADVCWENKCRRGV